MDVKMNLPLLQAMRARQAGAAAPTNGAAPVAGGQFADSLRQALSSVSQAQNDASRMQRDFQSGVAGVGLEETMVSMQKAQVGFQAALTVRNRLVSAYTDIMNMNV